MAALSCTQGWRGPFVSRGAEPAFHHGHSQDQAEERVVDVNELWRDIVALLSTELEGKAAVRTDLKPLPPLRCRPQQLSAVLSNLLRNGAAAMDKKGTILVSSDHHGDHILLEVRDTGRGMSREQLEGLFDLAFRTGEGRIAAANWGLFHGEEHRHRARRSSRVRE